ncbi:hypothetical protein ABIE30_003123 [Janthinobacterium lividum]|uniref:hypothetical protein n=1 Tax=Janthinobacterium lividum TaxID=29581 RepID=UPI003D245DD8
MNMTIAAAVSTLMLSIAASPSRAEIPATNTQVIIDIAGHDVPVAAGGLYDRFRLRIQSVNATHCSNR